MRRRSRSSPARTTPNSARTTANGPTQRPRAHKGDRRFDDGIKLLNDKLAGAGGALKDVLDFKFTLAEMAPAIRVRTRFAENDDAITTAKPKIEEAVARLLERNESVKRMKLFTFPSSICLICR